MPPSGSGDSAFVVGGALAFISFGARAEISVLLVPVYSQPMRGSHASGIEAAVRRKSHWQCRPSAIHVFLFFGAVMASLTGTTLMWRGTFLDHMWVLKAPAYRQLSPSGEKVGVPFLLLSAALAAAGAGWFGRRLWGWWLAVVIMATQVLGDLVGIFMGHFVRGAAGVAIASTLLLYLLGPVVRGAFVAHRAKER
jgi:hypothetical protein